MKKLYLILLVSLVGYKGFSQDIPVIKFDKVQQTLESKSDKIQIINFWATWCGPCIKELPYLEEEAKSNANVEVHLYSLDFADKLTNVEKFVSRKNISASKVALLDEVDYNSWIDKVDQSWSGAIPATLIINPKNGKRVFTEKELHEGDLQKLIAEVSN